MATRTFVAQIVVEAPEGSLTSTTEFVKRQLAIIAHLRGDCAVGIAFRDDLESPVTDLVIKGTPSDTLRDVLDDMTDGERPAG